MVKPVRGRCINSGRWSKLAWRDIRSLVPSLSKACSEKSTVPGATSTVLKTKKQKNKNVYECWGHFCLKRKRGGHGAESWFNRWKVPFILCRTNSSEKNRPLLLLMFFPCCRKQRPLNSHSMLLLWKKALDELILWFASPVQYLEMNSMGTSLSFIVSEEVVWRHVRLVKNSSCDICIAVLQMKYS